MNRSSVEDKCFDLDGHTIDIVPLYMCFRLVVCLRKSMSSLVNTSSRSMQGIQGLLYHNIPSCARSISTWSISNMFPLNLNHHEADLKSNRSDTIWQLTEWS